MVEKIESFTDENAFLSNFCLAPLTYKGYTYLHSEGAFQAQKCVFQWDRMQFTRMLPGAAKRAGRKVTMRADWDKVKDEIMYEVCKAKFTQNKDLLLKLIGTGSTILIEGNTWNDTYWGVCDGVGQNKLGRILMRLREELS